MIESEVKYVAVLTTAPDIATAKTIAAALVERRLAACVNLLEGVESVYWWEGRLESSKEVLLIAKSSEPLSRAVLDAITELHPYQVPEGIVLPITAGLGSYLTWIRSNLRQDCDSLG